MNYAHRMLAGLLLPLCSFAQTPPTSGPENAPTLRPSVVVEDEGPRYVAPNTLDRIGRIWAPVTIDGKGPYRLVLDTSGNSSAVIPAVVTSLGATARSEQVKLIGVTGTALVPVIHVSSMEVGELALGSAKLPVVADVFGGAEGVLGPKALADKRLFIDFRNDQIRITRS
ncbi:MAG TPA: aspartyl protease family protein, partial [Steroidobacteraceae bacterium]|nr:aspartyl protease family protein [Steroidobacteraceae bacterium]